MNLVLLHRGRDVTSKSSPATRGCRRRGGSGRRWLLSHGVYASNNLLLALLGRRRRLLRRLRLGQTRHADAEALHLASHNHFFALEGTLLALEAAVADLAVCGVSPGSGLAVVLVQVREGVGEAVEGGGELVARAAGAAAGLGDAGAGGAGDAGDEGRVLHEALVALVGEEVVADGGARAEDLGGEERVDLAGDAHVPLRAGGGVLLGGGDGSLERWLRLFAENKMERIDHLRREIAKRELELADLRSQLALAESDQRQADGWKWPLEGREYERYSRQMIVPNFGLQGQLRLKQAKVLLVGAGGLGCPAAAYLAGAGVGVLGLVDGDEVEVSNLHRQVAHSTSRVGMSKVQSAITFLKELNPNVTYHAHQTHLTTSNARDIVSRYDLVLDCTDHPTSRYLISDVCVLLRKPLVSASAFQTSGQLVVLNSPVGRGPCYRCLFPKPPPPESVVGCGEGGIVGPVVGAMGVLQALEAVKLVARGDLERRGRDEAGAEAAEEAGAAAKGPTPTMLLFSGMADTPFRSVRMRGRRKDCFACGEQNALTLQELESSLDYVQFCGVAQPVALLGPEQRVSAEQYSQLAGEGEHVLVDVREKEHFDLCHLEGAINVPIHRITRHRGDQAPDWLPAHVSSGAPIYVICRVGNDSQIAVSKFKDLGLAGDGRVIADINGGMRAWKEAVDPTLPFI
ncbi:Adenylyltransferase and sulfurtransferase uba4 [Paramyrothecium foliicola]|nr:Adenylyltransferase and sulfurtransferase uba4 [Paramyrothecium foliicola]